MTRVRRAKRAGGRKKARLSREEEDRSDNVDSSDAKPGQEEVELAGSLSGVTPQAITPKAGARKQKNPGPGDAATAQPSQDARTKIDVVLQQQALLLKEVRALKRAVW